MPGAEVDESWQTPAKALGAALDQANFGVVSLGRGGSIVLEFSRPIADGAGADFAVFENGFVNGASPSQAFLELAFVEVSSNGIDYVRFPTDAQVPAPVGAFGSVDASDVDGFAGKDTLGYGTPFDLADLPAAANLDPGHIRFIRLIDIVGDGGTADSSGDPIYDPYPTVGSAGFDLDAIGALHLAAPPSLATTALVPTGGGGLELQWEGVAWASYEIWTSTDLASWTRLETVAGAAGLNRRAVSLPAGGPRFYRIIAVE